MYSILSEYYDDLMEVDYQGFHELYKSIFAKYQISPEIILDLACGTGKMAELYQAKHEVIAIDISPEMLSVARERLLPETLVLCMDMRELDLYGTIDACTCTLDGMGSMLTEGDFLSVIERVNLFLSKGGIFIFDLISEEKFTNELDGRSYFYDTEDVSCVWQSAVVEGICNFSLTYFVPTDDLYERYDEEFCERVWKGDEVENLIVKGGMELLEVIEETGRTHYICKKGKNTGNLD